MTPTEQENELRDEIKNILNAESFVSVDIDKVTPSLRALVAKRHDNGAIDTILELITADRKRVALEARIDELERVYPQLQKHYGVSGDGNYYYDDRIAELKAQ